MMLVGISLFGAVAAHRLVADADAGSASWEALYEVRGYDNTNFDASLVYSQRLDTNVVWETRLVGAP